MKLTEEQIERARMVNLPDFLMSHGVELKKIGRSYVMKEHDSLNIKDNGPGEAGKWYRFSTSEGGDNISFVQQYMNCSFVEAVELLNNERYDREFQPQYRNTEHREKTETRTDISIDENADMKRVFAYLCSTRGLNSGIISELASQGKISQEAVTGNVIFKVFDENNKIVGAEKTGTSTQHKYKGIATGSAAGYGFELSTGKAEKTVFFESSIDLLSFYQMYRNILDNHRLVSMMGVKPSIVTETMQRYSIPPENVFLASDNDKAGNEFAERLMQEYPEMKRMKTPDRYKDWNDYIRNIPKEQEKAKEEQQMVTYGNEIWNKATDNKDKSLVTMYEDTFLDLQKKLDETGINYFAYVRDNIVTMAVNDKDTAWLSKIADLDSLSTQKSDVEYSPPEKNVFGNTEYRYIPQKEYISLDSDSALKMADMLNSQNISFSGRVYANGKGTLTVSRSDLDAVKAIQNDLAEMRKNYATVEKKSEIIGNTAYRDIKEKQYVYSKLTPEKYMEIKPALDEAVNYSGLIRDSRVIFTVDKKDFQLFNDKIAELTVKPDKEVEIRSDNTAEIPFDRKFAAEIKTVKDEMRLHDNLMELASVSVGNNDVYDFHFSEDLMEEIKKTGNEEFINTLIPNGVLDDRLMMEIFEDVYKELFSQGQALAAEETGIDNLRRPVKLPDTVGIKFTQHHPSSPELDSFINDTMADKEISFALASAVIEYLDDKHRYERINVPELEWYHETEFALNVLVDSNHLSYSARYDIGEGKYTGGGSLSDFIAYDAKELHSRDKIDDNTLSFITDTVVPFLKDHSQLTNEEQKILDDFKARHPVRQSERESRSEKNNITDKEESGSYFRIYQLKDGDEYHYTRFTDYQTNKDAGANLNISDYDLKYEDSWDEVPGISSEMKLDAIYQRFNLNHPNDFTGHSLSVSDVIVVGNDDSQTAYYVDDFGFTDFPEFFKEKEKIISNENISEPVAETEKNTEQEQDISVENSWKAYIIPDLSTWAISSEKNTPIERFDNIDDALKRFSELRKEPYNSVNKPNPWDNSSMARLTIGLESTDGVNAADIVHVRDGKNYLVDDFTRLDRMNSQQSFMDVVKKIADTVGIDRINVFEKDEDGKFLPPKDIEFSEWNNTFFKYEHVPDDDDDPDSGSGPAAPAAAEKKDESDDLETAKQLINRFCIEEYDSEADFSDLTNIGLAYTTNDDEQEIQVSANLVEFSLNTYVDGKLIDSEMYASIADMNENVFADMDFNELISTGMLYEEEKSETLEDKPLFTDASVIEEIQKNEKSSEKKPESEIMSGDQLNMFGDPVPLSESGSLNPVESKPETPEQKLPEPKNFIITDENLGTGGEKTKFQNNILAIQTLKNIEAENRNATPEEQEIMSRYVGWGGLAKAFDKENESWSAEYTQLKELLTPEEYRSAQSSVLDSYFTAPVIIDSIYEALDKFGFKGGTVLEPSCGVGNFIGKMPAEMSENSSIHAVEIDSLTARMAKQLYPESDIQIKGFENTQFQNGSFDVAVGNVPFGELPFPDLKYNTTKLHDFFFAQTMDKLKVGGIAAFITSKGTLDKKDESFRKQLSDKADLIGAVRLPNNAFKANAGTEVTSDIIFLQKRSEPPAEIPEWVHLKENEDGLRINSYFADNPDMALGKIVEGNKLYGRNEDTMCIPVEGADLREQLKQAVSKLSAQISDIKTNELYDRNTVSANVKIPEELRNYSLFKNGDDIFFKKNDFSCEKVCDKKNAQHKRMTAFIDLRDTTRALIEAQEQSKPDSVISALQDKLNTVYDDFYSKFGLIHSQTNKRYFGNDVSYNLCAGLEKEFDKTKLIAKSDIFTSRTIQPPRAAEHVDTALEALTLSVAERASVNFEYMSALTGMSEHELKNELAGEIFKVPGTENTYHTASEYLSGDIRKKLNIAEKVASYNPEFNINVTALKNSLPEPLKAGDIDIKIGATWLDPKIYEQFLYETLNTPRENRSDYKGHLFWKKPTTITVDYSGHTGMWHIDNKRADPSIASSRDFGSAKMNAYEIMEQLLNLKEPKIHKKEQYRDPVTGEEKERSVIDIDATRIVQKKAEKIKNEFKKWIFKDPQRREQLVDKYNELFNSIRPREYDGSNLSFPMMNSSIELHSHQKNAIAHAMFGGNTLFAHCVGAGKTYEMIATAMESKRLGLCTKSLFAVPNHLTEQIGDDFQKLYPSANILVATKKDFQKENRQQLFAKIATGNFDAVIIGHSQLGMIPVSKERQINTIQSQIDDIVAGIEEMRKNDGGRFQIKAMERTKKSLEKQLDKLQKNHDDTINFEQLGIDKLFIDEAHEFKNLFTPTKLTNVSGISNTASQKALDLFMKCRYLDEKTGGKGVVLATGTPLSNSVTELHTMMRYLEYDFLKEKGLANFDNWVTVFGEQKTDWELAPAGNKFKERTRIANYSGLPELMSMFKQVADIRTADSVNLDVPDCQYKVVNVEATPFQKELVDELSDRADDIQGGNVDPSVDNMLKITGDGRKLGLDPRLIDPSFEDNPNTKLNKCVENVLRIHKDTEDDRLTQIIFCDLGVPHKNTSADKSEDNSDLEEKSSAERESLEEECDFCVYDDIKKKLIAGGIPENEIAFIHSANTEKQKSELFDKVRSGEIRVLLGSTAKMGTGTNVQKKLIAVHDLDIPWRPADLEQRAGRIIRQGNENKNVEIYRYVTKGTFDAYSYQTLENKQKFISQIMTSKTPARKCEDVDQQALTYSEIKALCTGDERVKEKLMLDNEVKELRVLSAEHQNTRYEMEDKVNRFPQREQKLLDQLEHLKADRETIRNLPVDPETKMPEFKITIEGTEYTDRKEAAEAFEKAAFKFKTPDTPVKIGSFQGFDLSVVLHSNILGNGLTAVMTGQHTHEAPLIESFSHNLRRLEGALYSIDRKIENTNSNLAKLRVEYKEAQRIAAEPFPQEQELAEKEERLSTLTEELNKVAQEAKKNAPKKEKTCYFERAKLKKEAMKLSKQVRKALAKDKDKPEK